MSALKDHAGRMYLRVGGAALLFLIFLGAQLNLVFLDRGGYPTLVALAPLVGALLLLPRRVVPLEADMGDPAQSALVVELGGLERFVFGLRGAFYVLALVAVLVLPRVIPPPQ
jgi:hypothetical protein